jgi:hypothetical protein
MIYDPFINLFELTSDKLAVVIHSIKLYKRDFCLALLKL